MKILYFFPEYATPMFSWQRIHFMDELQRHGVEFETFNPLLCDSPEIANEEFIKLMGHGKYDLLLSSVCYPGMIFPDVLREANRKGIPTLCIRWDNLTIPFFDKEQAKDFDLLWLTARETAYLYKKWGANYIIQPYAANPYTFNLVSEGFTNRVCFIGTPYGSRSLMINQLAECEVPVSVFFGGGSNSRKEVTTKYKMVTPSLRRQLFDRMRFAAGRKITWGMIVNKVSNNPQINRNNKNIEFHPSATFSELSKHYSSFVLSLGSTSTNHTDALKNPLKIINLRNFEIPMSGGIEICKYNAELAGYFEDGKEIVFYSDNNELVEKAKYFITVAKESEIRAIKSAARKRAENEHTWWCRFTKAFDALGLKY